MPASAEFLPVSVSENEIQEETLKADLDLAIPFWEAMGLTGLANYARNVRPGIRVASELIEAIETADISGLQDLAANSLNPIYHYAPEMTYYYHPEEDQSITFRTRIFRMPEAHRQRAVWFAVANEYAMIPRPGTEAAVKQTVKLLRRTKGIKQVDQAKLRVIQQGYLTHTMYDGSNVGAFLTDFDRWQGLYRMLIEGLSGNPLIDLNAFGPNQQQLQAIFLNAFNEIYPRAITLTTAYLALLGKTAPGLSPDGVIRRLNTRLLLNPEFPAGNINGIIFPAEDETLFKIGVGNRIHRSAIFTLALLKNASLAKAPWSRVFESFRNGEIREVSDMLRRIGVIPDDDGDNQSLTELHFASWLGSIIHDGPFFTLLRDTTTLSSELTRMDEP